MLLRMCYSILAREKQLPHKGGYPRYLYLGCLPEVVVEVDNIALQPQLPVLVLRATCSSMKTPIFNTYAYRDAKNSNVV